MPTSTSISTSTEPLREVEMPEINYMERLQKELASCCMPSIKDISKASTDEITRDTYRVLTGNGNITGGLIVKVATANVSAQILQETMSAVVSSTNAQINRCNAVQSKSEKRNLADKVKSDMIRTALVFVWENKTFIVGAILGVAMYVNTLTAHQAVQVATEQRTTTEELVKRLDAKVTNIAAAQRTHNTVPTIPSTP